MKHFAKKQKNWVNFAALWDVQELKSFQLQGASPPGALPLDPAGGSAPDLRYRLALHALTRHGLHLPPTKISGSGPALKVIQGRTFWGTNEKQTMDCVSLYNNTGLLSKVSEHSKTREKAENCRCRQPHCRLTPISREPPRISA